MKALTFFVIAIVITQVLTIQRVSSTVQMIKANIDANLPNPPPITGPGSANLNPATQYPTSQYGPHGGPGSAPQGGHGGPQDPSKNVTTGCRHGDLGCLAQWYQNHGFNPNENGTTLLSWANCTTKLPNGTFNFGCGKKAVKRVCNESGARPGIEELDCAARFLAELPPCGDKATEAGKECWTAFKKFLEKEKHDGQHHGGNHHGPNDHGQNNGNPGDATRGGPGRGRGKKPTCESGLDPLVETCCQLQSKKAQKKCLREKKEKRGPCDNIDPLQETCCQLQTYKAQKKCLKGKKGKGSKRFSKLFLKFSSADRFEEHRSRSLSKFLTRNRRSKKHF